MLTRRTMMKAAAALLAPLWWGKAKPADAAPDAAPPLYCITYRGGGCDVHGMSLEDIREGMAYFGEDAAIRFSTDSGRTWHPIESEGVRC